ncbi:MAG: nitroreductase family protein [Actinobacteria bacterium HGW-Actinobacteria-1]|jgi:nitroreductase|nr:MAG: nitroreductase family protein [Actinobacteria bacterium HGW-Actinobacteria-1]
MELLDAIMTRRSIRKYTAEPVSTETIETILRAAMAAPSAGNQQPWRFVVLTERAQLDAAATTTPYGAMLREAPLAIVVCGDLANLKHDMMWQQDCGAAVENALLAAHGLGLGAVWLGYWPKMERVTPLKEVLGMPDGVEPFAVLAIGHPAETKPAADRYDAAKVRSERWS